jgi:hypothetical protein
MISINKELRRKTNNTFLHYRKAINAALAVRAKVHSIPNGTSSQAAQGKLGASAPSIVFHLASVSDATKRQPSTDTTSTTID